MILGIIFPESFMNSRISGSSHLLARSIIIWEKYQRWFSLPTVTFQANDCLHSKLVVTQELSPSIEGLKHREEAKDKACVLLLPLSRHSLTTGPLAGGMWWVQEWRKKTELLTKLSALSQRRTGKSRQ